MYGGALTGLQSTGMMGASTALDGPGAAVDWRAGRSCTSSTRPFFVAAVHFPRLLARLRCQAPPGSRLPGMTLAAFDRFAVVAQAAVSPRPASRFRVSPD